MDVVQLAEHSLLAFEHFVLRCKLVYCQELRWLVEIVSSFGGREALECCNVGQLGVCAAQRRRESLNGCCSLAVCDLPPGEIFDLSLIHI